MSVVPLPRYANLPKKARNAAKPYGGKPLFFPAAGYGAAVQVAARKAGYQMSKDLSDALAKAVFDQVRFHVSDGRSVHLPDVGTLKVVLRGTTPKLSVKLVATTELKKTLGEKRP